MDSQPPNDPNRGNNNNHNNNRPAKEVPFDGRQRGDGSAQRDGETMDVMGDLQEAPAVVVMFLLGVVGWILREKCMC